MELDHLPPRRRVLLWVAVVSGLLLAMLDQTIVGTALPEIVDDLGGREWYVWAFTAYLVPATVLLPVAARSSDRYGRQRVLLVGMSMFVAGSIVCSWAASMEVLTAGRAVQGVGAAALEAVSFILLSELSNVSRKGAGQAAIAAVMGVSFIAGPLVGGLLTDHAGWRWAFLVNVPIGIAAMAVLLVALPAGFGRTEARDTPLDMRGIAALTASVGALLIGINRHQELHTWADITTGGAVGLGVLGMGVLLWVERRAVAPVIPLRILTHPVTGRLLLAGAFATTGLYACVLLVPRWYQLDQGASATGSGVRIYPLLVGLLIAVNIGVVAVVRGNDVRGPLLVSGSVVLVGAGLFALVDSSSPGWLPLLAMAVLGLGMGPALSGLQIAIARTCHPRDLAAAMGTLLLGRQVVGVVALAVGEALYRAKAMNHGAAAATGGGVAWVAGVGALVALVAVAGLRDRLPEQGTPTPSPPSCPDPRAGEAAVVTR
ncbi:MFS transporter [Nocardioides sp.]|uniref:MFS transporter n=1 Tax=Nocardioides sp. TaxID=35761 RepID=UPI002C87EA9C|nr:MFS transporter [Nocardioides sp.]HXH78869.1 MFS transporter [Nocardioides sp.]